MTISWLASDFMGTRVNAPELVDALRRGVGVGTALESFFLYGRFGVFERELVDSPGVERTAGIAG